MPFQISEFVPFVSFNIQILVSGNVTAIMIHRMGNKKKISISMRTIVIKVIV